MANHDEAAKSAANFLLAKYENEPCDSRAVSDCIRCNTVFLAKHVIALLGAQAGAELPEPAAYAVREAIGDNLWFFTTKRAEAHANVGYKDSVEPLFTADQMREYARQARRGGS